ncbi:MAG: PaaI family thioesterase [Candidatus Lokiarchaeota archaeon]|nr:PaaI family thioesterase [Candidatus Lokiarchaeota archaeon]
MIQNTHKKINEQLCGVPIELRNNYAKISLKTTSDMVVDDSNLIHGGFIFSLADYSAMLAINHPNLVLGGAEIKFIRPVIAGDIIIAEGELIEIEGKKHIVKVHVYNNEEKVCEGKFFCFIPEKHVLNNSI